MFRSIVFPMTLVAGLFLTGVTAASEKPTVEVIKADGGKQNGYLVGLGPEGKDPDANLMVSVTDSVTEPNETKNVPLEDVLQINFVNSGEIKMSDEGVWAVLRDGSKVHGTILGGTEDGLKVKSSAAGNVLIKNDLLSGLIFPAAAKLTQFQRESFIGGKSPDSDQVLTAAGDVLEGFLEKITDKGIEIETGEQKRTLPYENIAGFRYASLGDIDLLKGLRVVVDLTDGSSILGKPVGMKTGKTLEVKAPVETLWKLPMKEVVGVRIVGGKVVFLSEIKPAKVNERPLVTGMPVVFKWQRNKSAAGNPLQILKKTYVQGIGVHAFSEITYALDGKFSQLICFVGMDAAASKNAKCSWKILGDDSAKPLASGEADPKKEPVKVNVKLDGAKTLTLVCDFGVDGDDSGDFLNFVDARLLRAK